VKRPVRRLGARGLALVERLGLMGVFLATTAVKAVTPPWRGARVLAQIHFIGARSVPVVAAAGLFVGMVVALQFHDTLVRFGSVGLLGGAVGLALVRELGPVLTALMVIGRAGSAMCAELGIMRAEEQIDALECMSIDPERYLVAPKLLATLISVPLLTALFDVVGIAGGYLVGVGLFGVSSGAYLEGMRDAVVTGDVVMGLAKSLGFALVIVWVATAKGFFLHLAPGGVFGAEGVSRVTTEAVVIASVSVLFTDYLLSSLLL